MTTMAGVSASGWPALPVDKYFTSSNCPILHEQPTQTYGLRSKTLEKRNSSLMCLSSSSDSNSTPCSSNRFASLNSSARARCFSKQKPRGGSQLHLVDYSSRQFRREWDRRCGSQQERLRVVSERSMKFQQLFRSAVFSSLGRCRRPQLRGDRQLEVLRRTRHSSRRESKERYQAQEERIRTVPDGVVKFEQQVKPTIQTRAWDWNYTSDGKTNWTQGCLNDLHKRVGSEDSEQDIRPRTKKARRDSKMPKSMAGFSFYEFLKECDRTWEKKVLGDRDKLEKQWEQHKQVKENDINSLIISTNVPEKRRAPKYPQTDAPIVHLQNKANGAEVYIIGTSHVSRRSVDQVREVIERLKPEYVLVELCRKRYVSLELRKSGKIPFLEQIAGKLSKGSASALAKLLGAALAGFSKMQPHHSSYPGEEFQVAMEEANRIGAKIVLGDQDIDETLMLLGDFDLNTSMEDAFRLFGQPMPVDMAQALGTGQEISKAEMFERFRDRKVVRRFNEEMQKGAPHIHKVLVDDRNEIMAKALRSLPGTVVAVVGLAHVDGLEQLWHEYNAKC